MMCPIEALRLPQRLLAAAIWAFLIAGAGASLDAASLTVVSAASYTPAVAPESIVSLFGSGLAPSTVVGTPNGSGALPLELAGVRVAINGRTAQLYFVSPLQINCVVPTQTETGTAQVSVTLNGKEVASGSAAVSLAAPSVFTADASGSGFAAALNAVTFAPGPFGMSTPANWGDDKRTRVAIFGTGFRYAGNPQRDATRSNAAASVQLVGALNNGDVGVSVTVEYAGPASGYPGLDQLNVVLPIEVWNVSELEFMLGVGDLRTPVLKLPILRESKPPSVSLSVSPAEGFDLTGVAGAFTPGQTAQIYTLRNTGTAALPFSAHVNVDWLALSRTSGTIPPGQSIDVAISPAAAINGMGAGYAQASVDFTGGGAIYTRAAYLTVKAGGSVSPASCELVTSSTSQSLRLVNDRADTKTVYIGNYYSSSGQFAGVVAFGFEMDPKSCQIVGLPRTGSYEIEAPMGGASLRVAFDGSPGFVIAGRRVYALRMAASGCSSSDQFDGQPAYSVCF
jgi:uncharacterized protein (TIGR03437 family)